MLDSIYHMALNYLKSTYLALKRKIFIKGVAPTGPVLFPI